MIRYFLDSSFYWDVLPSFKKSRVIDILIRLATDIFVKKNLAELNDLYIQLISNGKELEFYQVEDFKDQLKVVD